jgi:hypothetical protein
LLADVVDVQLIDDDEDDDELDADKVDDDVDVVAGGVGSAPIWLHVCANRASGLRLASNCKTNQKHL